MAIPGSIPVSGFVAPTSISDVYPSHDSKYGKGGYKTVENLMARDAIPVERRTQDMLVFVRDQNSEYRLKGGTGNGSWEKVRADDALLNEPSDWEIAKIKNTYMPTLSGNLLSNSINFNNNQKSNRTASIVKHNGYYYLIYTVGHQAEPAARGLGGYDPDADVYDIYFKRAESLDALGYADAIKVAISDTNRPDPAFKGREINAVVFNDQILVFQDSGFAPGVGGNNHIICYTYNIATDTWTGPTDVLTSYSAHSYAVTDGTTIYLNYSGFGGDSSKVGLITSTDGISWAAPIDAGINTSGPAKISMSSLGNLYIAAYYSGTVTVYKSTDNGATWSTVGTPAISETNRWDPCVGVDPTNDDLYVIAAPSFGTNGQKLIGTKSTDDGTTWSPVATITDAACGAVEWREFWPTLFFDDNKVYITYISEKNIYKIGANQVRIFELNWDIARNHHDITQHFLTDMPKDPQVVYISEVLGSDLTGDGSRLNPFKTLTYATSLYSDPTSWEEFSSNIIFDLAPGTYPGDAVFPSRQKIIVRGTFVTIDGSIKFIYNKDHFFGEHSSGWDAITFTVEGRTDSVYEDGIIPNIVIEGNIESEYHGTSAAAPQHMVLSNIVAKGSLIHKTVSGQKHYCTMHVNGCEFTGSHCFMDVTAGSIGYLHVINSKFYPTVCGNWDITTCMDTRFKKFDHSVDENDAPVVGHIYSINNSAYYNGFMGCRFQSTGCKFGSSDIVANQYINFDPFSLKSVMALSPTFDNVEKRHANDAEYVGYTPSAGADWADPDPANAREAIDRLAAAVAGLLGNPIP